MEMVKSAASSWMTGSGWRRESSSSRGTSCFRLAKSSDFGWGDSREHVSRVLPKRGTGADPENLAPGCRQEAPGGGTVPRAFAVVTVMGVRTDSGRADKIRPRAGRCTQGTGWEWSYCSFPRSRKGPARTPAQPSREPGKPSPLSSCWQGAMLSPARSLAHPAMPWRLPEDSGFGRPGTPFRQAAERPGPPPPEASTLPHYSYLAAGYGREPASPFISQEFWPVGGGELFPAWHPPETPPTQHSSCGKPQQASAKEEQAPA